MGSHNLHNFINYIASKLLFVQKTLLSRLLFSLNLLMRNRKLRIKSSKFKFNIITLASLILALIFTLNCGNKSKIILPVKRIPADRILFEYVKKDDGRYDWHEIVANRVVKPDYNVYQLQFTSQEWQSLILTHNVFILIPKETPANTLVALIIDGEIDSSTIPSFDDLIKREQFAILINLIATKFKAPVAFLLDVPYQPLWGKKEDALIAYTFSKFLETEDTTWPCLLPMVKTVVKAMDTVQYFLSTELQITTNGFFVTGASKRGWTTWLTPVVDNRVRAIVPVVYDNLDIVSQMKHQLEMYGDFSVMIKDYLKEGLPQMIVEGNYSETAATLLTIIDPYTHINKITVPKLLIVGTNDPYWTLDSMNIYYDKLQGEKYILYVPNGGHDFSRQGMEPDYYRPAFDLIAFFLKSKGEITFPIFTWDIKKVGERAEIVMSSNLRPSNVRVWVTKHNSTDFRNAKWNEKYLVIDPDSTANNYIYKYAEQLPEDKHLAIFGEVEYFISDFLQYYLSTNVKIFKKISMEIEE